MRPPFHNIYSLNIYYIKLLSTLLKPRKSDSHIIKIFYWPATAAGTSTTVEHGCPEGADISPTTPFTLTQTYQAYHMHAFMHCIIL